MIRAGRRSGQTANTSNVFEVQSTADEGATGTMTWAWGADGRMIIGSDSHTRYGALGTMAVGEGGGELVGDDGRPRVLDFGLAAGNLEAITHGPVAQTSLAAIGLFSGSPAAAAAAALVPDCVEPP